MSTYIGANSKIHSISRGLLVQGEKVILCQVKDADWYFLPGGHIEDGEPAKEALARELHEEFESISFEIGSFIGVCESSFAEEDGQQHEINLVFAVEVEEGTELESALDHLHFSSVSKDEFAACNVRPAPLQAGVERWMETSEPFFAEI